MFLFGFALGLGFLGSKKLCMGLSLISVLRFARWGLFEVRASRPEATQLVRRPMFGRDPTVDDRNPALPHKKEYTITPIV